MALLHPNVSHSRTFRLGLSLAFFVPLLYALHGASAFAQLGTGDALVTAVLADDAPIAHASRPAVLVAKLVTWVPVGPLALRISLASGLLLALASLFAFRAIHLLVRAQGVGRDELSVPLALGLSFFAVGMPELFGTALHAQAHTLQLTLGALLLYLFARLEASFPTRDLRPLYAAAIGFGIFLGNDVPSAIALLPALLPTLARVHQGKGSLPIARVLGLALFSFAACRAGDLLALFSDAPPALRSAAAPLAISSYLRTYASALGVLLFLSVLGAIALLQTPGVKRLGVLFVLASVLSPFVYFGLASGAHTQSLGMLGFTAIASALLAAGLIGALLAPDARPKPTFSRGQLAAVLLLLLIGSLRLHETERREKIEGTYADSLASVARHRLPPRALILASARAEPSLRASEAEDRVRPDVSLVARALFDDPHAAQWLSDHARPLRPLLRAYLLGDALDISELESLAGQRPVFLDLDASLDPQLYEALRPTHLLFEVLGTSVSRQEERYAAASALRDVSFVRKHSPRLAEHVEQAPHFAAQVGALGLYFTASGDRETARSLTSAGAALAPKMPLWAALRTSLEEAEPKGPIDVAPLWTRARELLAAPLP